MFLYNYLKTDGLRLHWVLELFEYYSNLVYSNVLMQLNIMIAQFGLTVECGYT